MASRWLPHSSITRSRESRSELIGGRSIGAATPQQPEHDKATGASRAFRGLVLVFLLSFFNLIGLIVTAIALGGLAPWSRWQFIGVFGLLEAASGLANVISPNIWRLPVAELTTSGRTEVKLAASSLLLPIGAVSLASRRASSAWAPAPGRTVSVRLRPVWCRSWPLSPGRYSRSRPS